MPRNDDRSRGRTIQNVANRDEVQLSLQAFVAGIDGDGSSIAAGLRVQVDAVDPVVRCGRFPAFRENG